MNEPKNEFYIARIYEKVIIENNYGIEITRITRKEYRELAKTNDEVALRLQNKIKLKKKVKFDKFDFANISRLKEKGISKDHPIFLLIIKGTEKKIRYLPPPDDII